MAIHVSIQGAFRPTSPDFLGLNEEEFATVCKALRTDPTNPFAPEPDRIWKTKANGGSIFAAVDSAYNIVKSDLTLLTPDDDEVVIPVPELPEWLDLGELGHEFTKQIFLKSKKTGIQRAWEISVPVGAVGTFQAQLFIWGTITTG